MFSKLFTPEAHGKFQLPIGTYYVARFVKLFRRGFILLSRWETRRLSKRFDRTEIDRPVYITGLARAGTTITLEMLSQHPDVATHRYFHIPNPYIPYWWDRFVAKMPLGSNAPVERIHKDGVMVTKDSPEALEEPLWKAFFRRLHDENRSHVMGAEVSNKRFEKYYRDHIWKLLISQQRTRYVAKSNYSVTRMEYLLKLFPDVRFLLVIRNPVNHIASYLKQNRLFEGIEQESRRTLRATQLLGHHEFGNRRSYVNVGNTKKLQGIRKMWAEGKKVEGCARYWASIYDFVADSLERNKELKKRTFILRYEDLCAQSEETLGRVMEHTGLDSELFAPVRDKYVEKLRPPTYYNAGFSEEDLQIIGKYAGPTAERFGYRAHDDKELLFRCDPIDAQPAA